MSQAWIDQITLRPTLGSLPEIGQVRAFSEQLPWISIPREQLPYSLEECIARDSFPLPETNDREGYYGERHFDYWLSGLDDWTRLAAVARRHGRPLVGDSDYLDLGCSSGRVLRHAYAIGGVSCWGADINRRNIAWMQKHLSPKLKVFQNTALPHLPLPDASMDVISAFSVFTHIDDLETAWLLELRRILKPGGLAYISLHTDHGWSIMGPNVPLYSALINRAAEIIEFPITPGVFKKPLPQERLVLTFKGRYTYHCNVFHAREYIRREWGRFMDVVEIVECGADWHDVAVLRRV
ncbi:MAG: class I SAM-dependent methyltransferase [Phycisphaerales bacterium]|nr:class I SAM-dependent methyltransferase [Phycisphaerales bacterium]